MRWMKGYRLLCIDVGAPHLFCYSDGEYLGTETEMAMARSRCERGEKGAYVMEFETTEQVWKKLKPKPAKLAWTEVDKSNWQATIDGELLPVRVRRLDDKTFAVYRDGKYLGSEPTLADAKMRADIGAVSQRNTTMRLWEQKHPDELPPFLQLTKEERAEYWRHHPPVSAARPAPPRRVRDLPEPVMPGGADVAVGAEAATLQPVPAEPKAGRAKPVDRPSGGEKPAPVGPVAHHDTTKAPRGNERDGILVAMLKRGCTREEILRVTGWKAVSVQDMAKRLGVGLRVDKDVKPFKYHAEDK